jgi:hypothetical protein
LKAGTGLRANCGNEIVPDAEFCQQRGAITSQSDLVGEPTQGLGHLPPDKREGVSMAIREYRELVLVADEAERDVSGLRRFTVQVFSTPGAGEGTKELRELSPELARDLSTQLYRLEHRKVGVEGVIAVGEALADLLLPTKSRELFTRSLDKLERGQGLRIRLRLHPWLADIPWEYM